jgi:hypothetical protein
VVKVGLEGEREIERKTERERKRDTQREEKDSETLLLRLANLICASTYRRRH